MRLFLYDTMPPDMDVISTVSNPKLGRISAYPYSGSAYEDEWVGYRILVRSTKQFVDFRYQSSYCPDEEAVTQRNTEKEVILERLKDIVGSVSFDHER